MGLCGPHHSAVGVTPWDEIRRSDLRPPRPRRHLLRGRGLDPHRPQRRPPGRQRADHRDLPPGDGGWRAGSALGLAVAAALRWAGDFGQAVEERVVVSAHTHLPGRSLFAAPRRVCVSATADHGEGLLAVVLPARRCWRTQGVTTVEVNGDW